MALGNILKHGIYFRGTGEQRTLYEGNRQYWGTGNTRKHIFETDEQANLFVGTGNTTPPPGRASSREQRPRASIIGPALAPNPLPQCKGGEGRGRLCFTLRTQTDYCCVHGLCFKQTMELFDLNFRKITVVYNCKTYTLWLVLLSPPIAACT